MEDRAEQAVAGIIRLIPTYRLASYWLPLCAGPVAYGLFRLRYRRRPSSPQPSVTPA